MGAIFADNNIILTLFYPPFPLPPITSHCLPRARKRYPVSSLEMSCILTPHPLNVILMFKIVWTRPLTNCMQLVITYAQNRRRRTVGATPPGRAKRQRDAGCLASFW